MDLEAFYCGRFFIFYFLSRKGHMNFYEIIDLKTKPMVTECYSIFSSNALLLTFSYYPKKYLLPF